MPIAPLLQRFVDDELARAPLLIEQVRVAATENLQRAGAGDCLDPAEVHLRREAARALHLRGDRFSTQYVDALRALVHADLAAHERPGRCVEGAADAGPDSLALMDESLVESDIEISRATMLIDSTVEWEQRELQTFASALRGEKHVGTDSNPLRPSLVARALWEASAALEVPTSQRVQVLRAAAAAIGQPLKHAYAAACSRIEAQGIEPSLYRTVLLAPGSVADTALGPARQGNVVATQPGALQRLLAEMPAVDASRASPMAGVVDVDPALARLDALMRRTGAASVGGSRASGGLASERAPLAAQAPQGFDPRLIELLSRLFDALLADPALPASAKGAIARLQVSALRVALRDPALLDSHEHPTWRLMDRIAHACQQTAAAGPARLAALALACDALADDLARHATPDAPLYRQGLVRLDTLVADDLRQAQQAAHSAIAALQGTDRRMRILTQVRSRLEDQFVRCPVGTAVRRFLLGHWAQQLADAIVHAGPESEATASLTRTVDDLLWSLHPPAHPASRQRLVKLLPDLLARLRTGMARCGLEMSEQQAVLVELETSHSATLWPGGGTAAVAAHRTQETPEDIVRRLREETAYDAPPRRDFGDSVLDLSTLDTVPAGLMPDDDAAIPSDERSARARRAPAAIAMLAAGRAGRLLLQGRWIDAQLLWRSEGGELLLFADGAGCTHALTRRALERLYAEGLAQFDPPGSLVQRAIERLLASLRPRPVRG